MPATPNELHQSPRKSPLAGVRAAVRLVLLVVASIVLFPVCALILGTAGLFGKRARYTTVMALTVPFCRLFATLCGLRISVEGQRSRDALIFVGNHVTYMDILVAGATAGGVFVSRHDVKNWPVIGLFARLAGTVFLDRTSLRSAIVSSANVSKRAAEDVRIVFFPEGKTNDGEGVGQFRAFMFTGVAEGGYSVQPFTIIYTHVGGAPLTRANKDMIYWYRSDQDFVAHGWGVLKLSGVKARVIFHEPFPSPASSGKEDVRQFAEALRLQVESKFPYSPIMATMET